MFEPNRPALVLAPMEGITDAPMRDLQGESGCFTYAVSEFLRVSVGPILTKVFLRDIPELAKGGRTSTGLPVQVQILGGDPERMALSAQNAVLAGATAIDINFGCPAPTVNRHDGGASLLKHPTRIREVVAAVRDSLPAEIPVSAKLRLGWEDIKDIHENAQMAAEGGASWLTIHARTRTQGYKPPVFWPEIGTVRKNQSIPIIANGDIWTIDDFHRCQEETRCQHFMIGRSALANPNLPYQINTALGIGSTQRTETDWINLLERLTWFTVNHKGDKIARSPVRLKQWLKLADNHGNFPHFQSIKLAKTTEELMAILRKQ